MISPGVKFNDLRLMMNAGQVPMNISKIRTWQQESLIWWVGPRFISFLCYLTWYNIMRWFDIILYCDFILYHTMISYCIILWFDIILYYDFILYYTVIWCNIILRFDFHSMIWYDHVVWFDSIVWYLLFFDTILCIVFWYVGMTCKIISSNMLFDPFPSYEWMTYLLYLLIHFMQRGFGDIFCWCLYVLTHTFYY